MKIEMAKESAIYWVKRSINQLIDIQNLHQQKYEAIVGSIVAELLEVLFSDDVQDTQLEFFVTAEINKCSWYKRWFLNNKTKQKLVLNGAKQHLAVWNEEQQTTIQELYKALMNNQPRKVSSSIISIAWYRRMYVVFAAQHESDELTEIRNKLDAMLSNISITPGSSVVVFSDKEVDLLNIKRWKKPA